MQDLKHLEKTGVLIVNLGTPDSPSVSDVRKYLKEFLWDPRVVKAPRPIWWLVLNGVILTTRPKKSAAAYAKVWTEDGSPLLAISRKQTDAVREKLSAENGQYVVELGMRYGSPSMASAIESLDQAGVTRIVVVPMYPQFSHTTTSTVEDELYRVRDLLGLKQDIRVVPSFHDHPAYIQALADSVTRFRQKNGAADKLLLSFHGIPKDYAEDGDPYPQQCVETAELLAQSLKLEPDKWVQSYQSRLGPKEWLTPYTDKTLEKLGESGLESVDVICPGFSVDCLETLEEVAMENRDVFLEAGGKRYHYIPCLNDHPDHIDLIIELIHREL